MSAEAHAEAGITDNLIRISAGLEDAEDLLEDLNQAFSSLDRSILMPVQKEAEAA